MFQGDRLARLAVDCHPERSEGSDSPGTEILSAAKDDRHFLQKLVVLNTIYKDETLCYTSSEI